MLIIATLIFIGILLMLIELLLIPGVGVAGILGLASLAGSCWYAFARISARAGVLVTIIVIVLVLALLYYILRAQTWKKLEQDTVIEATVENDTLKVKVGDRGKTITRLAPQGTAVFEGASMEVKSFDNNMVDPGTPIEIVDIKDNKILIRTIN